MSTNDFTLLDSKLIGLKVRLFSRDRDQKCKMKSYFVKQQGCLLDEEEEEEDLGER